ncbi:MAG: hypothetical protein NT055_00055, partial [Nitrospirae bacterium]|nr:hypothetical protein [Nitrospirota bacterium]
DKIFSIHSVLIIPKSRLKIHFYETSKTPLYIKNISALKSPRTAVSEHQGIKVSKLKPYCCKA